MPPDESSKTTSEQWDDYWSAVRIPTRVRTFNPATYSLLRLLLGALPAGAQSIFELGCAPGAWLAELHARTGLRVAGCDYSKLGAEWTRRNFEALGIPSDAGQIHETDVFDLNRDAHGEHDLVFSRGLVEHFKDTRSILAAHAAVTRAGGTIVISAPNLHGPAGRPYYLTDPNVEDSHEVLSAERLSDAARALGLDPIFAGYGGPFSAYVMLDRMHGRLARTLAYGACTLAALLTYGVSSRSFSGQVRLIARKPLS